MSHTVGGCGIADVRACACGEGGYGSAHLEPSVRACELVGG